MARKCIGIINKMSLDEYVDYSGDPSRRMIRDETLGVVARYVLLVRGYLEKLNPKERFIIYSKYLAEFPWGTRKIADELGMRTTQQANVVLKRALRKLRNMFNSDGLGDPFEI